jgi:hypothetical protein
MFLLGKSNIFHNFLVGEMGKLSKGRGWNGREMDEKWMEVRVLGK